MKTHNYAQTKIQLFNQLINYGYSNAEMALIHNAYQISARLFGGRFQSSDKDFIAHGVGTASILGSLRLPAEAVAAGLIHNVYGNGDFGYGEKGVSDAKRKYIKDAIGEGVEEYVYRFTNTLRWNSQVLRAIRDDLEALGPIERNTILIRLAEILEKHLDLEILYTEDIERQRWMKSLNENGPIMVEIAERLGFSTLAADLKRAFKEILLTEIPVEFQNKYVQSYSFVIPPKSYRKRISIELYQRFEPRLHSLRRQLVSRLNRLHRRLIGLR